MVEVLLGASWIYLMYRVGSIHGGIQSVLKQVINGDAEPEQLNKQNEE